MTHAPTVILSHTAAGLAGLGRRLEVPSRLGSVLLLKPLAEGGMSVVHLGRHEILQKSVAVKFMLDLPASPEDPRFTLFLEGARAAAAIRHPGLNIIYNAESVEGVPYIVMELIEGPTLAELLRQHGPLPLHIARGVIERICDAVGELHAHELIHRDIKPPNIMIDPTGRVVVTDFGLAMQRPAALFGGAAGGLAGTPAYMAPEMFDGNVSTRTDVYALGVTMYELLTGKPPFEGDFQAMRFAHRSTALPLASLAERGVPEDIIVLMERATHKEALYRPKSARHVLDAFAKACDAANITRASEAMIQRYIEVGHGAVSTGSAPSQSTPAYYERLNTLAEVKRRTPEATLCDAPAPADAPASADSTPVIAAPVTTAARADAPAVPAKCPRVLAPRVLMPILAVLGTLCVALTFHLGTWLYEQIVLFYDRMNWLIMDPNAKIAVAGKFVDGRMPIHLSMFANAVPAVIFVAGPMLFVWWPYLRMVLAHPPRDGVTRCGWCWYPLSNLRDPRCPECGRLLGSPRTRAERPVAKRWSTRLRNYAVAGIAFLAVVAAWGSVYVPLVRPWLGSAAPALSLKGTAALFGLFLPATLASLGALHFVARSTAALTGRTYCGRCATELVNLQRPECPGCAQHI